MCGIHFTISNDTFFQRSDDFMSDAFVANQLRGMHSSGIYVLERDKTIRVSKAALCGQEFIKTPGAKDLLTKVPRARLAVGHVRHATQGRADDNANAHPFLVKREDGSAVVGVHNGTLRNWKMKDGSKDIDVDSQWAFTMLAEHGHDAFKFFDGAFAFVWHDTRSPDSLFMARNSERPLHYMLTKDGKSILGASELGMLGWLAERNKIDKAEDGFRYLKPGVIYEFDLREIGKYATKEYVKYDPTTMKTPTVSTTHYSSLHPYANRYNGYDMDGEWEAGDPWGGSGTSPGYDARQELTVKTILSECTAALKDARRGRLRGSGQPATALDDLTEDQRDALLDEAINAEISRIGGSTALVPVVSTVKQFNDTVYISHPNDASAAGKEIEATKTSGAYGAVVEFSGILYDKERSCVMGNIRMWNGGKWTTEEAELRGIPEKYANVKYIDVIAPVETTVVGWNPNYNSGLDPYYVLAELTDIQKKLINAKRTRKQAIN